MSEIAINCEGVGKRYRIGQRERYVTLRDAITSTVISPLQRFRGGRKADLKSSSGNGQENFWALTDVSFEVRRGEVVGIIGRNGAGKSTLLKILSRITKPTAGIVQIHGRVGSLLEVGTGFHPELTGRENIYLNGAILGMRKAEITRNFDEIVAFAEVEKFIDTPVKRYSSGMYVRLAFGVAAHLEPEVLIVDEVLAVGDAQFQKKCLGKMGEVAKHGRTVLFVSHNMGAVMQLCSRAILLSEGRVVLDRDSSIVVSQYLSDSEATEHTITFDLEPDKDVQITSMSVLSPEGQVIGTHPHTAPFCLRVDYRVKKWNVGSYVCLDVFNESDVRLLWSSDVTSVDEMVVEREPGTYQAYITIPGMILSPGRYYFTAAIYSPGREAAFDLRDKAIFVEIMDAGSLLSNFGIRPHAATMIPLSWETKRL